MNFETLRSILQSDFGNITEIISQGEAVSNYAARRHGNMEIGAARAKPLRDFALAPKIFHNCFPRGRKNETFPFRFFARLTHFLYAIYISCCSGTVPTYYCTSRISHFTIFPICLYITNSRIRINRSISNHYSTIFLPVAM